MEEDELSDLSEEMHRDFECFSDSDDDMLRSQHGFQQSPTSRGGPALSVGNVDADRQTIGSAGSRKSRLQQLIAASSGSPRTAYSKATTARAVEKVKEADKPVLGIIYFIIFCFLRTLSYVFASMLYN